MRRLTCLFVAGALSCASNSARIPASQQPPSTTALVLPLRASPQTTDYTCGPAATLSLLRYYGRDGDELRLAREMHTSTETGTTPENIAEWLRANRFRVTWGENGSLAMLRANLARGLPTLVEWIDWGGHWVIVIGYDTRGTPPTWDDLIYLADPGGGTDGLTIFNAERFDSMWFDAFLFARPMKRLYVVAEPE